jgi:hypothetical protein
MAGGRRGTGAPVRAGRLAGSGRAPAMHAWPRPAAHPLANAPTRSRNHRHGCSLQEVAVGFGVRPLDVGRHYL